MNNFVKQIEDLQKENEILKETLLQAFDVLPPLDVELSKEAVSCLEKIAALVGISDLGFGEYNE